MKNLWAPWRMKFIDDLKGGQCDGCFLCDLVNGNEDEKNHLIARSDHSFIVMNKYPYNCGHLMIVPKRHIGKLADLKAAERADLMELSSLSIDVLCEVLDAEGFNCGFNIGRAAGAGVDSHVHLHVVPRWSGDSNFLPVIGDTKSMPEYLDDTYKKLKPVFDKRMKRA